MERANGSSENTDIERETSQSLHTEGRSQMRLRLPRRYLLGAAGAGVAGSVMGIPVEADSNSPEPQDVTDSDWTMWRFNRANTGQNPHSLGTTEFPDSWEYDEPTDQTLYSPAVADGVAYFGTFDNRMHAVDVETKEQIWTAEAGGIIQSTPTILEGVVYAAAYDGEIYAWDAQTGAEIWNIVGGGVGERTTSVTVSSDEETIFVGSDDAVYSLVPETGEINWEFPTADNLTASPSVAGGTAYQGDWSGNLYAIDVDTGQEVWSRQLGTDIRSTAAVVDGVLYLGVFNGSNTSTADSLSEHNGPPLDHRDPSTTVRTSGEQPTGLYALDASNGDIHWMHEMDTVFSSPAVAEGLVFVADYSGTFVAVDQTTGDPDWSHQFETTLEDPAPTSSPAYANGVVYAGSAAEESTLFVFDAQTGDVLEELDVGNQYVYSPAVTEDAVYVTASPSSAFQRNPATLHGYRAETEARAVIGTVTGPDAEPVVDAELYLFPRQQEHTAIESVLSEYPEHPDPETVLDVQASGTTDTEGEYSAAGLDPGDYHMLVLPQIQSDYEPVLAEDVIVSGEETERNVQLARNRPLAELDDVMRRLVGPSNSPTHGAIASHSSVPGSRGLVGLHLETITEQTAQVTIDAIDEAPDPEDLISVFNVTDSALDYDLDAPREEFEDDLRRDVINEGLDLAERGLDRVLEIVWEQLDPELQNALTGTTGELGEEEWFVDLDFPDLDWLINQGYMQNPLYTGATAEIDDARDHYDVVATQEPAPGFSRSAAKEILEDIRRQVENPDQFGVPGYVAVPKPDPEIQDEKLFEIDQSETYAAAFRGTEDEVDNFETAGTVAQAGKVIGGAMILTGKGAPVGAKVMKLSAKGYKAAEFAATIARIKLMLEAVLTIAHWGIDTHRTAALSTETVEWLDTVAENPDSLPEFRIADVDMNLTSVPVVAPYVSANQPPPAEVPEWLSDVEFFPIDRVGIQTKAVYNAEITVENITDSTKEFELTMYNQYDGGRAVSNEASLYPDEGEVAELGPGEQTTVELEYVSDFRELSNLLHLYTMVIQVWSDGVLNDEEDINYRVLPGIGVEGTGGATAMRSSRFAVTRAGKGHDTPITVAELDELSHRVETIVTGAVDPEDRTESVEVTADEDTTELAFMLTTTGAVALQVFDEQGRQVGFDPAADEVRNQIPDARYVGPEATPQIVTVETEPGRSYTVQAVGYRFISGRERDVTIHRIDTPERDALLSVAPDRATTTISPGESRTARIYVSETGEQVAIEGAALDVGELTDGEGNELPNVDIEPAETEFEVPAGDIVAAGIELDAGAELSVPNAPEDTRFEGDIQVETANAGSLEVSMSALVLATDLEDVVLRGADPMVEGIEVSETSIDSTEPPEDVTPVAAYTVEATGSGSIDIGFPRPSEVEWPVAFAVEDGEWEELNIGFVDDQIRVSIPVDTSTVVIGDEDLGIPALPGFGNPPEDLNDDGLYEDVNGDGTFDIHDIQALFDNLYSDPVQDNPEAFNFNEDEDPEEVTIFDVQALFNRLQDWEE